MSVMKKDKQIKSKSRVVERGEVYTAEREVNDMLDLVKHETKRIDSKFLEPACGNGNFLIEILRRKMKAVKKYKGSQLEYERYSFIAISSMYGIDIMQDNVVECRERLFNAFLQDYKKLYKKSFSEDFVRVIKYILEKNIVCGNALTMKFVEEEKPLVFSEWSMAIGSMVKRRDYSFESLLDNNKEGFIPNPLKDYPLIHLLRVCDYE